jgi:hypothetical protein
MPRGPKDNSLCQVAASADTGETPLDYMLRVMRDGSVDHDRRDKMAAAASPYIHPKLANVEMTGKDGGKIQLSISKDDVGVL